MSNSEVETKPIVIDPNTMFKVVLECHESIEPQPHFVLRHLSARKYRELSSQYDSLDLKMKDAEALALTNKLATTNMVGWYNQVDLDTGDVVDFDISKIDLICSAKELWELITKILVSQRIDLEAKKKSDLLLASSMEESAKVVEVQPDAETSQPATT